MLDDGLRPTTSEKLYEQASIVSKLIDVFRCHGAVELNITDLIPQAYERDWVGQGGRWRRADNTSPRVRPTSSAS